MSQTNDPPVSVLLTLAQQAMGLTQEELGELLGVSRRSISRWVSEGTDLSENQVSTLARAVYPANPSLATKIAVSGGSTLEGLGIVQPPKPIEPPRPPPAPPRLVDVVVCAAAEALDASPRTVRRAVLAAFEAARDVGLDVDGVVRGLGHAAPSKRRPERVTSEENVPGTRRR
jgi:transcriptional regulator with XRE-family HTH domain